jgi:hypothetical protein
MASGLKRAPGKDTEWAQCRDLTLFGSPLPGHRPTLRPLTGAQVETFGIVPPSAVRPRRAAAVPTRSSSAPPSTRKGRGKQKGRVTSPAVESAAAAPQPEITQDPPDPPSSHDGLGLSTKRRGGGGRRGSPPPSRSPSPARSSPDSVAKAGNRRVAELERKLAQQDERIRQLFAQQLAEPHEDVSPAYVVLDEVWQKIGKDKTEDRCSWLNINALKKREIGEIMRLHSGTFPHFPCELDVIGTMKRIPGVKDVQLTLVDFAQTEVAKFMRSNARTVRMSGTVFSRVLEMQLDLADFLANDPTATDIPLDWVVEFVDKVVGIARGTFAMSLLDTQTARIGSKKR